jgi:lysyl-tRNA synthetase class 2
MLDNIPRLRALRRNLIVRSKTFDAIRSFFTERNFLQVDTPSLTATPIPEANIEPFPAGNLFLGASPELHMKQLLGAGYGDIFQLCHSFRQAESGRLHNPEFSILEWYRARGSYLDLMTDCEGLIRYSAGQLGMTGSLTYQGQRINLGGPWPRITVRDAYLRWAGWDPLGRVDHDRFDIDMVEKVEPGLKGADPVFLVDYPAAMASLARLKPGQPGVAERFELYIGGLELANGFTELTDPAEQRARFAAENTRRAMAGRHALAVPEALLSALPSLPACAGCALGLDRLVMLFCNARSIDEVMAFPTAQA